MIETPYLKRAREMIEEWDSIQESPNIYTSKNEGVRFVIAKLAEALEEASVVCIPKRKAPTHAIQPTDASIMLGYNFALDELQNLNPGRIFIETE